MLSLSELEQVVGETNATEIFKIVRHFVRQYSRKTHTFMNKEELESECLLKLAQYCNKGRLQRKFFLKSFAQSVKNHFNSLLKKNYLQKCREVKEVTFSALESSYGEDTSSFIEFTEELNVVDDTMSLIVFKEQLAELVSLLAPLSASILNQLVEPDVAFTQVVKNNLDRKIHLCENSSQTVYIKPKIIVALAEFFGQTRQTIRASLEEIQHACLQIFPEWQSELNFCSQNFCKDEVL